MVLGAASTAIAIALPILKLSQESIEKVNKACAVKGLPPAFELKVPGMEGNPDEFDIQGNPDYRFEGFGLALGIPLRLSFWVHYRPGRTDQVSVGKILVPIRFSEIFDLPKVFPKI